MASGGRERKLSSFGEERTKFALLIRLSRNLSEDLTERVTQRDSIRKYFSIKFPGVATKHIGIMAAKPYVVLISFGSRSELDFVLRKKKVVLDDQESFLPAGYEILTYNEARRKSDEHEK